MTRPPSAPRARRAGRLPDGQAARQAARQADRQAGRHLIQFLALLMSGGAAVLPRAGSTLQRAANGLLRISTVVGLHKKYALSEFFPSNSNVRTFTQLKQSERF